MFAVIAHLIWPHWNVQKDTMNQPLKQEIPSFLIPFIESADLHKMGKILHHPSASNTHISYQRICLFIRMFLSPTHSSNQLSFPHFKYFTSMCRIEGQAHSLSL